MYHLGYIVFILHSPGQAGNNNVPTTPTLHLPQLTHCPGLLIEQFCNIEILVKSCFPLHKYFVT